MLVISDTHFPYAHPDVIAFLKAVKAKYKPDRVVHIGDEIDGHAWSFHPSDPDLASPGDELASAIQKLQPVYKMFPKVDVIESNHGSLIYRKAKVMGLPRHVFRSYREVIEAPKGWKWHFDLTIELPDGSKCYFHHALSSSVIRSSQQLGMHCVFGHHHNKFSVEYWSSNYQTKWAMFVGCLINHKAMAYEYGQNNLKKPIIGCGIIIDSAPVLLKMNLDKDNRWTKKL